MMANVGQPFLPQNAVAFPQQSKNTGRSQRSETNEVTNIFKNLNGCSRVVAASLAAPPENHFGQVDVNDLLSKLISNGIIKPSQPDAVLPVANGRSKHLSLDVLVLSDRTSTFH